MAFGCFGGRSTRLRVSAEKRFRGWKGEPHKYIDDLIGFKYGVIKAVYFLQSNGKQAYVTCYITKKKNPQHGIFRIMMQTSVYKEGLGWKTELNVIAKNSKDEANEVFKGIRVQYDKIKRIK